MTNAITISNALDKRMFKEKHYHLKQIYIIVEGECQLDKEDFNPQAPGSSVPKWKRNVRNGDYIPKLPDFP